jgi:hypothetical protein
MFLGTIRTTFVVVILGFTLLNLSLCDERVIGAISHGKEHKRSTERFG